MSTSGICFYCKKWDCCCDQPKGNARIIPETLFDLGRGTSISTLPANKFDTRLTDQTKDEWLTPPDVIKALGEFDLDPCSPIMRPWDTAKHHYSILDNGFLKPWAGRVWLNPPYGQETRRWIRKLAEHGNGIALTFARTETKTFFPYVWDMADAIFFFAYRLNFYNADGSLGGNMSGAPSVLIAYGQENAQILQECETKRLIKGKFISLKV